MEKVKPIEFQQGKLRLIDQRKLPEKLEYYECTSFQHVCFAIKEMVCRGAPLIGTTAAYGVALACREFQNLKNVEEFYDYVKAAMSELSRSRPTAVNLFWALRKMEEVLDNCYQKFNKGKFNSLTEICEQILNTAHQICNDDINTNYRIAEHGEKLIPPNANILTHCNTGALATSGYGTALGVVRQAHFVGKNIFVYADETRPRLQGSKLTAWELMQEQIPYKIISDSVSAMLMKQGQIDLILVGADRIAHNGDTANKIGTLMLSVLANEYNIPFYVVAPTTTIDGDTDHGDQIIIEERSPREVTEINGCKIAPKDAPVFNPAFDVTPAENISKIITEQGVFNPEKISSVACY